MRGVLKMSSKKVGANAKTNIEQQAEKREKQEKEVVAKIIDNYQGIAESLAKQLKLSTPNHDLTTGTYREEVWMSLFAQIVPRKFCLEQGVFIIDSDGQISNEVDIAIFDEMYTPYIFNYGKIKFIPIEAVAVAVQCKSTKIKGAKDWAKSIVKLKTSLSSIVRIHNGLVDNSLDFAYQKFVTEHAGKKGNEQENARFSQAKSQTSTRPILILCALLEDGVTEALKEKNSLFDIVLNVDKEGILTKTIPDEEATYHEWYRKLNHHDWDRYGEQSDKYEKIADVQKRVEGTLSMLRIEEKPETVTDTENVVLSLTFQLNQMLMLINNPIFFPHQAYVNMFRKNLNKRPKKGEGQ
ncbi:hypothetical protein J40TS1_49930 [Paenibacillus montaniterrae]|uniref:DUF6602 domain-containing protein n=1 Tax=Paenibacillus montaniterrae TaxID=429341 RepID=A0A919YVL7_9BACL|nr:DUF6602 domain-containing protein [Paenibacillus montaniterrae]GIP19351.1 hypothetical protein J40TS1_49930 [Paenibacillus montaniterrae]